MYLRAFHYCDLICFLEKGNFLKFWESLWSIYIFRINNFICLYAFSFNLKS